MLPKWRYLRGRIILTGRDPDELSARDVLDAAEAILIDSFVMGHGALDDVLAQVNAVLDERFPDPAQWGLLPHQRAAAAAAEGMFAAGSVPRRGDTSTL